MFRHRKTRRFSPLAAPIAAALAAVGGMSALTGSACWADVEAGRPVGTEWFRDEPPRAPGEVTGVPPATTDAVADNNAPAAPSAPASAPVATAPVAPASAPVAPSAPPAVIAPATPFTPSGEAPRRPQFADNNAGGFGRGGYSPFGYNNDYPSGEVYSYVVAQARLATAQALFRRAETELSLALRDAQADFENSQAFRDAVRDENTAYNELIVARRKALSSLSSNPRYQKLSAFHDDLSDQIAHRRAARDLRIDELLAMATLKLDYATDMRAMEADVLASDGADVKSAEDRLVAAGARVATLRRQYDNSLRTNSDIIAARRNLEDARIVKITADAYVNGAAYSVDQSLDYAYYLHRRQSGNSSLDAWYGGGWRY